MVMVFQWGWGAGLIGLESTVPIVSFIPMFMFAILFGLSMDYEVFLLSRVRGEYAVTGDNDASVVRGIASTARVITSAALIMISVFLGFVLGDDPAIKMFGLGLATAIFVDATIVRMVLVPATMKLMGDANWWIPGWLDRLLPSVDIEGIGRHHDAPALGEIEEPARARAIQQDRDGSWRHQRRRPSLADHAVRQACTPAPSRCQSRRATSSPHDTSQGQAWTPIRFAWRPARPGTEPLAVAGQMAAGHSHYVILAALWLAFAVLTVVTPGSRSCSPGATRDRSSGSTSG